MNSPLSNLARFFLFVAVVFVPSGIALAQLTDADRERIAAEMDAAAEQLDGSRFPDLESSKSKLLSHVDSVERYFETSTDQENRDAWLRYIDVDPLVEQIESDQSPSAIGRQATDLRYRLIGIVPGLELTVLRDLRDSVEQLIEAIRFHNKEKSKKLLSRHLTSLAEHVRGLDDNPSSGDVALISTALGILESSGQAEELAASLRDTFGRPNVAILIGQSMVDSIIHQEISQIMPVRECILGTRIVGTAELTGTLSASLHPSVGAAKIGVSLDGQIVSNNLGFNGPVRLRTTGQGDVHVTQTMNIDDSGITFDRAITQATLETSISSIEHPLRFVRNIARRRASQQKAQADRIALGRMSRRVGTQFESQTGDAAATASPNLLAKIRPVLKRMSHDQPECQFSSTDQAILVDATFRRPDQLSAVLSPPPITEPYDAAIQIHESVFDNAMAPVLAGRTFTEDRLRELLDMLGRELPTQDASEEGDIEPSFEIDFADRQPIVFEARDQTVRIGVRGTRFAQGSREIKESMEITATYQPVTTADGTAMLRRVGNIDVDFGRERLRVSQAGIKRTIQKKFSAVFPSELLDRALIVPEDSSIKALQGRAFRPQFVDAQDGWLTITIK
jgi:hypothetical protein